MAAKVKYVGPYDAVDVPLPNGGWATVQHGGTLETTAEHAKALCRQVENWEAVARRKATDEAPATTEGDEA